MDMSLAELQPGRNDCEAVVLQLFPELKELVDSLQPWGKARMSGTGSTFFLTFDNKNAAIDAAEELKSRYNVRAVSGVDRSHLLDSLSA
jgi:4-diphosphocytidyl-2-C-methyl-D-erythritol kinase